MTITFRKLVGERLEPAYGLSKFQFPGGEQHIKVTENLSGTHVAYVQGADAEDYVSLMLWADVIRSNGGRTVAIIPYLPAARADRGHPWGAYYYAQLINQAAADQVICFDAHSPIMPDLVKNLTQVTSASFIRKIVRAWDVQHVIVPDKGAFERANLVASALGVKTYQAEKTRDFETGALSGFAIGELPKEGNFLVVDDICDGGGTFIGLAEATGLPKERLQLWVSHGIFSKGTEELNKHYGKIFTTESHPGHFQPGVTTMPIIHHLSTYIKKEFK